MSSAFKCWEPLWGNFAPKVMDKDEVIAIDYLALAADLEKTDIEPVLDIRNRKTLRVKIYKTNEYTIDMYDYLFFGPLVFSGKNVYLAEQVVNDLSPKGRKMTKMLDTDQLIAMIKRQVSSTLGARKRLNKTKG